jgi:hypothetical protein
LKSEFIGVFSFHADPIVGDQFPSCYQPWGAAGLLPLPDSVGPDFIK